MRKARGYHTIFIEANGPGPWPCMGCEELVHTLLKGDGVVHHVDHNHSNDEVTNLKAMHHACHTSHHLKGVPKTVAHRAALALARVGMTLSDSHKKAIGDAHRGTKHNCPEHLTDEHKRAISAGQIGRKHSPETLEKLRVAAQRREARKRGETL